MSSPKLSLASRLFQRIFPKTADFYLLLHQQCQQVCVTVDNLARFMASESVEAGKMLKEDEHEADRIRMHNLHELNSSFATPIDREDIYRAIASMDSIVTYCKSTYNEMEALELNPDSHSQAMVIELQVGIKALERGFAVLGKDPAEAEQHAFAARHSERRIEKMYCKAIADLFQGDDYLNMFKQRELYRHLSNAADKVHATANVLEDIIVKLG
ncbi:DUF47 domain-containing protein [Methylomonas sp. YC3]